MIKGAIILCGGKSTRMGCDKANLAFGSEQMLQRIVRLMSEVVETNRIVVVAAKGQVLPRLPELVTIASDFRPEMGPLEGLAAGLRATDTSVTAVYATSCDAPRLKPPFVQRMFELLGPHDIVVPRDEHYYPLAAVYRPSILHDVQRLLDRNIQRMSRLFEHDNVREISLAEILDVDPGLTTLENLNTFQDYERALSAEGFDR